MEHALSAGVYIVRTQDARQFAATCVLDWVKNPQSSRFRSCLWLTTQPVKTIEAILKPHLQSSNKALRGLDVISVRKLSPAQRKKASAKTLCKSLDTLSVLSPRLVVVEDMGLWLNTRPDKLLESSPLFQLGTLQSWAHLRAASVMLPLEESLPPWSAFVDGLADETPEHDTLFKPWWPTPWGKISGLWNDTNFKNPQTRHLVFDLNQTKNLGQLAKYVYMQRFLHKQAVYIHALLNASVSPTQAALLLRLGADTVVSETAGWSAEFGLPTQQTQATQPDLLSKSGFADDFAKDFQEILTPGQLCLVTSERFCASAVMLIKVSKRWGFECSLTRLSLLNHVTAHDAASLIDLHTLQACALATQEAIYLFRIWTIAPSDERLEQWVEDSFKGPNAAIFGGLMHYTQATAQIQLLHTLWADTQVLTQAELELPIHDDIQTLTDVWVQTDPAQRQQPWTENLNRLFDTSAQTGRNT